MSEEQNTDPANETQTVLPLPGVDELAVLKERAKLMGITFSNNIGVESLRKRIEDKLNGEEAGDEGDDGDENPIDEINPLGETPVQRKLTLREEILAKQMALVRVRITCMDPKKKDLPGEVFTVANEYIGTVRKYVPFGEETDDGYHVPYCIFRFLEERRFLNIRTVKDRRTGANRTESTWAKEFALEVLPQLTEIELAQLATAQAAAGSIDKTNADLLV